MDPVPRNSRAAKGRNRLRYRGRMASGATACRERSERTTRTWSLLSPARCFHQVCSHSQVKKRQFDGLDPRTAFHSGSRRAKSAASSIVSITAMPLSKKGPKNRMEVPSGPIVPDVDVASDDPGRDAGHGAARRDVLQDHRVGADGRSFADADRPEDSGSGADDAVILNPRDPRPPGPPSDGDLQTDPHVPPDPAFRVQGHAHSAPTEGRPFSNLRRDRNDGVVDEKQKDPNEPRDEGNAAIVAPVPEPVEGNRVHGPRRSDACRAMYSICPGLRSWWMGSSSTWRRRKRVSDDSSDAASRSPSFQKGIAEIPAARSARTAGSFSRTRIGKKRGQVPSGRSSRRTRILPANRSRRRRKFSRRLVRIAA